MTLRTWARDRPSILSARKTSSLTRLPASGPTTKSARGTAATPHDDEEDDAADEPHDARELGQGQAGEGRGAADEVDLVRMIAAEVFGEEPDDRVIDDVEAEDLAVELLPLQDEEEHAEIEEVQDGLVK